MWSKEEIDILMSNIERYLKVCVMQSIGLLVLVVSLFCVTCFNFLAKFVKQLCLWTAFSAFNTTV